MQAYVVTPDRLDPKALADLRVRLERRVKEGRMVHLEPSERLDLRVNPVLLAQRVLLAPRVPPGEQARRVRLESQARRATLALRGAQAPKD